MSKKTILDILSDYDISVEPVGELYRGFCPFHEDVGKPNFTVWPKTNSWFCFVCNKGGNIAKLVAEIENISYNDAKQKLAGFVIEMDELNEIIESIGVEDDPVTLNNELNILLSKFLRNFLYKNPDKIEHGLNISKLIDNKLLLSINYNNMPKIVEEVKQKLKNFV